MKRTGFDGEEYSLVFSDEFEQDGRSFWPGDDPYWTAIDGHYCQSSFEGLYCSHCPMLIHVEFSQMLQTTWNTMIQEGQQQMVDI